MNHKYQKDSELDFCEVCHLFEGSLTTDCSGEPSSKKSDDTYAGKLDYREGLGWVNMLNPTNQSWLKSQILNFINGKSKYNHENEIILAFGIDKKQYEQSKSEVLSYLYGKVKQ